MVKSNYKLLIFDWDGTLSDSVSRIAKCIQLAAADHQLPVPSYQQASNIIGLGLMEAVRYLFPEADQNTVADVSRSYSAHYRSRESGPPDFFPHVLPLLKQFKANNYLLAVATGKSRAGLNRALQATGLERLFDSSRCADETQSKPSPLMLEQLLEEFQLQPEQAIMVGDTEYDMEMAAHIAMPRLAVSYGAHSAERLQQYQPVACIDCFSEIINYV